MAVDPLKDFLTELNKWNPEYVAEEANISRETIRCWLLRMHNPSLPLLVKVAKVIGYEVKIKITVRRKSK